jgi:hypothetical protein
MPPRVSARTIAAFCVICLVSLFFVVIAAAENIPPNTPLPDPRQLKDRVLNTERKAIKDKERYLCHVYEESDEADANGKPKKHTTSESEEFYVNGQEIDHKLSKDGHPLTGDAAKKEQERVDREVKKFSDPKQVKKAEQEDEKEAELFLKALRYTNGRRDYREGRAVLTYDMSGDPDFHPRKLEEQFAHALTGHVSLDEESGELMDLQVTTDHDIKIFGFIANVKKGFQFHLSQKRQPDGVWIANLVEGNGSARALFFNRNFRFLARTDHCRLYNVDATSTAAPPPASAAPASNSAPPH